MLAKRISHAKGYRLDRGLSLDSPRRRRASAVGPILCPTSSRPHWHRFRQQSPGEEPVFCQVEDSSLPCQLTMDSQIGPRHGEGASYADPRSSSPAIAHEYLGS